MRDTFKNEEYFRAQIENGERRREKFVKLLSEDETEQARQTDLNSLFKIQFERALSLYCVGAPITEVKAELNKAWPLFVDVMTYSQSTNLPMMEKKQFIPGTKLLIFPLLVLSDCDRQTAIEIFEFTNSPLNYQLNNELNEVDAAFDPFTYEFAKYFGFHSEKVSPVLDWPQLYDKLYQCFTVSDQQRPAIVSEYLDDWMRRAIKEDLYTKDAHLKPTNKNFRGYWCFLAAAVVKMLSIDDTALRNHPLYPYDIVNDS